MDTCGKGPRVSGLFRLGADPPVLRGQRSTFDMVTRGTVSADGVVVEVITTVALAHVARLPVGLSTMLVTFINRFHSLVL
mmetsp:Transcript_27519/g.72534  ORF Transcript_27519/g.72534 Transcript_27519/m.72534 type:complete len:80 (-) Transcript_27519:1975-2214(-)